LVPEKKAMLIRVTCPSCRAFFDIGEVLQGKAFPCPKCSQPMAVPFVKSTRPGPAAADQRTSPIMDRQRASGTPANQPARKRTGTSSTSRAPVKPASVKRRGIHPLVYAGAALGLVGLGLAGFAAVILLKPFGKQEQQNTVIAAKNKTNNIDPAPVQHAAAKVEAKVEAKHEAKAEPKEEAAQPVKQDDPPPKEAAAPEPMKEEPAQPEPPPPRGDGEQIYQRMLKSTVWILAKQKITVAVDGGGAIMIPGAPKKNLPSFNFPRPNFPFGPGQMPGMGGNLPTLPGMGGFGPGNFPKPGFGPGKFPTPGIRPPGRIPGPRDFPGAGGNPGPRDFPGPGAFPGPGNFPGLQGIAPGGQNKVETELAIFGSGSLVDVKHRLVLTNVHVVGSGDAVVVHFPEFEKGELVVKKDAYKNRAGIQGKVVLKEDRCDLALVQLERLPEGVKPVSLSRKSPKPAQQVHSVGNPGASRGLWIYSPGRVRQVFHDKWKVYDDLEDREFVYEAKKVETDSPINPGDSGGPLVNDQGQLVAVAHGASLRAQNMSIFIDVSECQAILEKYYRRVAK
jgi:S1-C subfamily serine protease